jgi:hypothetical protein
MLGLGQPSLLLCSIAPRVLQATLLTRALVLMLVVQQVVVVEVVVAAAAPQWQGGALWEVISSSCYDRG